MTFSIQFSSQCQQGLLNAEPFVPYVCLEENQLTQAHNAIVVNLDAMPSSRLYWEEATVKAKAYVAQGLFLVWKLNMVHSDVEDEFLIRTNGCAIDHFIQTLWKPFCGHSLGVVLQTDSDAECDLLCDYLRSIAAPLFSFEIPVFLLCDCDARDDLLLFRDRLPGFVLVVKGRWQRDFPYAFPVLSWEEKRSPIGFFGNPPFEKMALKHLSLGLLYPVMKHSAIDQVIWDLRRDFRIIPERLLTHEWTGLSDLIVCSQALSPQGKRKVLGFVAAGGRVITLKEKLMVPGEINFTDFLNGGA